MKQADGNMVFETTGRWFRDYGYIGAMYSGDSVEIAQGYDNLIEILTGDFDIDYDSPKLTQEEKTELADYMISMWEKFKTPLPL